MEWSIDSDEDKPRDKRSTNVIGELEIGDDLGKRFQMRAYDFRFPLLPKSEKEIDLHPHLIN